MVRWKWKGVNVYGKKQSNGEKSLAISGWSSRHIDGGDEIKEWEFIEK